MHSNELKAKALIIKIMGIHIVRGPQIFLTKHAQNINIHMFQCNKLCSKKNNKNRKKNVLECTVFRV